MSRSGELFDRARRVVPGGVNSPVRAFRSVGGTPRFVAEGRGAYLVDADGTRVVDLVQSWGALLFGHAREEIVAAAVAAARRGTSFGAPTEAEVELAERVVEMVPSVERVRLVSSGTEATMSAIRLARGFTGRSGVVKFAGCYHGHSDALLATAGSGVATLGLPDSPGVTEGAARDTFVVRYNDREAVRSVFEARGELIACAIVEPVAANMGVVPPAPGFLEELRELCDRHGSLLVLDEVVTGFRLGPGGAQERFGLRPDLTCLGKVLGGGFPLAAFGGRADVMDLLAPEGPVYQAGTLSGNPVAVAAGLAALDLIGREDPYPALERAAVSVADGVADVLEARGVPHVMNREGTLLSLFFSEGPVTDYASARAADHARYAELFHGMLASGVYLPPSGYEGWFLSAAHGDAEVDLVVGAAAAAASRW
ncbi:MAG: glutamate-1-semialdehyde 2,1-aminomutase [Actinobacteria bacterium]|nr:glutamate-1-semialdehyde 2,1-aminomutase [Actinomycetota bacterium]